jgi:hypothetical protein
MGKKRFINILISCLSFTLIFTSCTNDLNNVSSISNNNSESIIEEKENNWFSDETLQKFHLLGLPKIEDENMALSQNTEKESYVIYFNYTDDQYHEFLQTLYNFLINNPQIYHFSRFFRREIIDYESRKAKLFYKEVSADMPLVQPQYRFAYSFYNELIDDGENDSLIDPIGIYIYGASTLTYIYENKKYRCVLFIHNLVSSIYLDYSDATFDDSMILE